MSDNFVYRVEFEIRGISYGNGMNLNCDEALKLTTQLDSMRIQYTAQQGLLYGMSFSGKEVKKDDGKFFTEPELASRRTAMSGMLREAIEGR